MKKRRLVGPLTPIQEQQEALKDVGLPEDLVGKIYEIISNQHINGKEEGYWIRYAVRYCTRTNIKVSYLNGKMHGKFRSHYLNGIRDCESNYLNGLQEGKCLEYNLKGGLFTECNYMKGKKHGKYISYNPEGTVYKVCDFINGKLVCVCM